jgi:predicted permease
MRKPPARLPFLARLIFGTLLPLAERDEVLADLRDERASRADSRGRVSAWWWVNRQAAASLPSLLRRGWWRGTTGFEPRANRLQPGGPMFESWIMDLRYAARRLRRRRTYAALAVLTLALGAGGTAAVFGIVRTLLLDPLPIAREEQVGVLWFSGSWSEAEFLHLRPNFPGFQRMTAYRPEDQTLEVQGEALRLVPGAAVSAEFFDTLGRAPLLGRTFHTGDDAPGAEPAVVLSHALWQELGGDAAIAGKPIRLGGVPHTVAGVMPRGFWFPSPKTRIWTAAQLRPQNRSGRYTLVGRVAAGASIDNMAGPLRAIADAVGAQFPSRNPQWDKTRAPSMMSARDFFVGDLRPSLIATLAAMAIILLIACANVAALMLGQLDARATELAVRSALGADRRRLIQQLIIESLLVAIGSGLAGAALAAASFEVLVRSLPLGALAETARLNWTVFWASMLTALGASLLVAIVPGLAVWRGSRVQARLARIRTNGIAGRGGRLESGLVIAQMALAVMLAAGAGLLIRSVANLHAIDPGIDVRGLLVVDAILPAGIEPAARARVILDTLPSLQAIPGIKTAAAAQKLPLRGSGDNWGFRVRGRPDLSGVTTAFRMVSRDYFTTMGIPVLRGRSFDASDRLGSERVVVINDAMAGKVFPGEDPIGRVVNTGFDDRGERIIGVVGNTAEAALTDPPVPARYMLYEHVPPVPPAVSFVLRTENGAAAAPLLDAARAAIRRDGRQLAVQEITTMTSVFETAVGAAGQIATLLSMLAGLALILGAVGVYGVISHYVTRRARDYGIRIALGQAPSRVVRDVVSRGASLAAIGSAVGVAGALLLTRMLLSLLYGVKATDPLTLGAAVAVLLFVGMLAAFLPARRASLTDPSVVLRE